VQSKETRELKKFLKFTQHMQRYDPTDATNTEFNKVPFICQDCYVRKYQS